MKYLASYLLLFAILIAGCSGGSSNPVTDPLQDNLENIDISSIFTSNSTEGISPDDMQWQVAWAGMLVPEGGSNFRLEENRDALANMDATSLILNSGNFRYDILGINGNLFELELTITNPTSLMVYDVRIIFNNFLA